MISFSGLILTAKHILEGPDHGARAPDYLLTVLIRPYRSVEFRQAELLVTHPFMDLAILIARTGDPIPPLKIGKSSHVERGKPIILIGHERRSAPQSSDLFKVRDATVDEVNRHGNIIAGRGVDQGTSGGPAIFDGRLIGVVRSSAIDRTTIVPLDNAHDYLRLRGVLISDDGNAEVSDDIAKLAAKISLYERILGDIQVDVNWKADVAPHWASDKKTPFPEDFTLTISYDKKLDSQPPFAARISVSVTPIFDSSGFRVLDSAKRVSFPRADWLEEKGTVVFSKFGSELASLLQNAYAKHGINRDHFRGFDIGAEIKSIVGPELIGSPQDQAICFLIRFPPGGSRFTEPVRASGRRCALPRQDSLGRDLR